MIQRMMPYTTSPQWINTDDGIVQKRSAHQQHEDAQREQKTYNDKYDREIDVGIYLLHD